MDSRVRQMDEAQRVISERIEKLIRELERIGTGTLPNYWVVVDPGKAGARFISRKRELMMAVRRLRSLLQDLNREERALAREKVRDEALRRQARTRATMGRILHRGEKRGRLTPEEEAALRRRAERNVNTGLGLLGTNPSPQNMKNVLQALEDLFLLGGDPALGDKAVAAVGKAARKNTEKAEQRFRQSPTQDNFKKIMEGRAAMQALGEETKGVGQRPPGFKPAPPGTRHEVRRGDTLAKISEEYYGSSSFWDIIYLENVGVIGGDVTRLQAGTKLVIP